MSSTKLAVAKAALFCQPPRDRVSKAWLQRGQTESCPSSRSGSCTSKSQEEQAERLTLEAWLCYGRAK